jgi:hypothetical protein
VPTTTKDAARGGRISSPAKAAATHGTRVALIGKTVVAVVVVGVAVTGGLKLTHNGPFHRSTPKTHKSVIHKKASPVKKTAVAPTSKSPIALAVPASGSGGFNYTQGSYLEGFQFKANSSITITKLGAYDSNLSNLPSGSETFVTVPVALYDISTHAQVGSVNVSASDPPTGVYRYAALSRPVTLSKADTYAVVWVSLTDYYIALPTLVASDVNPAIDYLAMTGLGPGGLTETRTMVEPNWTYTKSTYGLKAINYDLGPNFLFTSRTAR